MRPPYKAHRRGPDSVFLLGPNGQASLGPEQPMSGGRSNAQAPLVGSGYAASGEAGPSDSISSIPSTTPSLPISQSVPPRTELPSATPSTSLYSTGVPTLSQMRTRTPEETAQTIATTEILATTLTTVVPTLSIPSSTSPTIIKYPTSSQPHSASISTGSTSAFHATASTISSSLPSGTSDDMSGDALHSPPIIIAIVLASLVASASIAAWISWMIRSKRKNGRSGSFLCCFGRERDDPIEKWDYGDAILPTPTSETSDKVGSEDRISVQRHGSKLWDSEPTHLTHHNGIVAASPYLPTIPATNIFTPPPLVHVNHANASIPSPSGGPYPRARPLPFQPQQDEPFPHLPIPSYSQQNPQPLHDLHNSFGALTVTNLAPGDFSDISRVNSNVVLPEPPGESPWSTPTIGASRTLRMSPSLPPEFGTPREHSAGANPRFMGLEGHGLPVPWAPLRPHRTLATEATENKPAHHGVEAGGDESQYPVSSAYLLAPRLPTPAPIMFATQTSQGGNGGGWATALRSNLFAAIGGAVSGLGATTSGTSSNEEDRWTTAPPRSSSRRRLQTPADLERAAGSSSDGKIAVRRSQKDWGGPPKTTSRTVSQSSCSSTSFWTAREQSRRRESGLASQGELRYPLTEQRRYYESSDGGSEVVPSKNFAGSSNVDCSPSRSTAGSHLAHGSRRGNRRRNLKASLVGMSKPLAPVTSGSCSGGQSRLYHAVQLQHKRHTSRVLGQSAFLTPRRSASAYSSTTGGWTTDRGSDEGAEAGLRAGKMRYSRGTKKFSLEVESSESGEGYSTDGYGLGPQQSKFLREGEASRTGKGRGTTMYNS